MRHEKFVGLCERLYGPTSFSLLPNDQGLDKEMDEVTLDLKEEQLVQEIPEKPSRWKKTVTISAAIFLILLMVSYTWVSYGLDDIIISLLESKILREDRVEINETTFLVFKEKTYQTLLGNYLENQDKEFKACLLGTIKDDDYEITEIVIPEMTEQSFNQVISKRCPESTIVELHSHPYRRCIESEQDLKTKEIIARTNPEALMIIMCEKYRFKAY